MKTKKEKPSTTFNCYKYVKLRLSLVIYTVLSVKMYLFFVRETFQAKLYKLFIRSAFSVNSSENFGIKLTTKSMNTWFQSYPKSTLKLYFDVFEDSLLFQSSQRDNQKHHII